MIMRWRWREARLTCGRRKWTRGDPQCAKLENCVESRSTLVCRGACIAVRAVIVSADIGVQAATITTCRKKRSCAFNILDLPAIPFT